MNDFENLIYKNGEGGYIFISHSHLDIDKVRIIRNILEKEGYEPLCFYLKCLTDDDEVEGLIQREIDCRDIFLYIESDNSKKSDWVKKERDYISGKDKTIYRINIDKIDDIYKTIEDLLNSTRVFLSYSHLDKELVNKIIKKLLDKDLKIFNIENLTIGDNFEKAITSAIDNACEYGCFIPIITKNYLHSAECKYELNYFLTKSNDSCMNIIVGGQEMEEELKRTRPDFFFFQDKFVTGFLSTEPTEEELNRIAIKIRNLLMYKLRNNKRFIF